MEIPPRTVTDAYLASRGVQLDLAFDVDLGELTRGHHIVARGIMFGRPVRVPKRDPARLRALMDAADDPNNGGGFIRGARNAESAAWEERLTGADVRPRPRRQMIDYPRPLRVPGPRLMQCR
jgi:hypothetical protein